MGFLQLTRYTLLFRAAAFSALVALIAIVGVGSLSEWRLHIAASQARSDFGNAIAHQLAQAAAPMMVTKDTVSLQSVLSDIATRPPVAHVAVYSVQNQVIAEAGQPSPDWDSYSAGIHFQDSLAGQVVVGLDSERPFRETPFTFRNLLATALGLVLAAALAGALAWQRLGNKLRALASHLRGEQPLPEAENSTDELGELVDAADALSIPPRTLAPEQAGAVVCAVGIANIEQVFRQLSAQELETLLGKLQRVVLEVCALYDGELVGSTDAGFAVRFQNTADPHDAVFRSLCTAQLVAWLFPRSGGRSVITAGIARESLAGSLLLARLSARRAQRDAEQLASQAPGGELRFTVACSREPGLGERVGAEQALGSTALRVVQWQEPYLSLLRRQHQQLGGNGAPE